MQPDYHPRLRVVLPEKLPRKHKKTFGAYPEKKLYIHLLFVPSPDDPERKFQVRFRTEQQIENANQEEHWFPLGDILKYKTRDELRTLRRSKPEYRDNNAFEDNLDALWTAIHERHSVSYYLEKRQDLDDVLEIFKRLNTGGTPLSYSDLLLSLATATWKTHDAREQVYELVDFLNKHCGSEFWFSKDFILKNATGMQRSGRSFQDKEHPQEDPIRRYMGEGEGEPATNS